MFVQNAFSTCLSSFGFNFYQLFAPDLLHEFELGVWKAVFTHLLRVLYAAGGDKIQELNERCVSITICSAVSKSASSRFRQIPTFGRDTIRRISNNTSGMKKLAARDWEDILQCAIPVFEGLLPAPYDAAVQDLLFTMATWHAYAKLRLHTDSTLSYFEKATTSIGQEIRRFNKVVCSAFETYELPSEEAARGRRTAAMAKKPGNSGVHSGSSKRQPKGKRQRAFNMATYKLHTLGDYVWYARMFGPLDNYSTQVVSMRSVLLP